MPGSLDNTPKNTHHLITPILKILCNTLNLWSTLEYVSTQFRNSIVNNSWHSSSYNAHKPVLKSRSCDISEKFYWESFCSNLHKSFSLLSRFKIYFAGWIIFLPTASSVGATWVTPAMEMEPCDARNPKMPQNAPGILTPPMVSIAAIQTSSSSLT